MLSPTEVERLADNLALRSASTRSCSSRCRRHRAALGRNGARRAQECTGRGTVIRMQRTQRAHEALTIK